MLSLQLAKIEVLNERKPLPFFQLRIKFSGNYFYLDGVIRHTIPNPRIIETTHEALQSNW